MKRTLADHASAIRALGKRVQLPTSSRSAGGWTEAKRIAGHGNWLPWLEREVQVDGPHPL